MFFVQDKHMSARETYKTERMTTEEIDLRMSRRRKSDDLIRQSGRHNPLIRVNTGKTDRFLEGSKQGSVAGGDVLY
jgi:hypothetical protein